VAVVGEPAKTHPAKYTDAILERIAEVVVRYDVKCLLDSHAGTGKIGKIRDYGYTGEIYGVELEAEWALQAPKVGMQMFVCDAERTPFDDDTFDGEATSPVYGNRMSDHCEWKDDSKRNTYKSHLGRALTPGNTGMLQWGDAYRDKYLRIWREQRRVLKDGAVFALNCKDHYRKDKLQLVTDWHVATLEALGFVEVERYEIPVTGNGYGQNGDKRVPYESVVVFRLDNHKGG
jgi:SAM-dependent methyltransferase